MAWNFIERICMYFDLCVTVSKGSVPFHPSHLQEMHRRPFITLYTDRSKYNQIVDTVGGYTLYRKIYCTFNIVFIIDVITQ